MQKNGALLLVSGTHSFTQANHAVELRHVQGSAGSKIWWISWRLRNQTAMIAGMFGRVAGKHG